jgi:RNA polymerase primary sigma factor
MAYDTLNMYFKNVGRHNLLTREDEQMLAKAMEAGDKRARDRMIQSNLRLAISIAKRYMNKGCAFEDLVQESNIGLIKAVDRFDWRRGVKFSTYATWWIRQSVRRLVSDSGSNIKMPASANIFYYRAKMMIREYTEEFGFAPSDKEVAEFMGCSLNMYQTLMNTYRGTLSLDAGRIPGDPDSPSLGESIQDMNAQDPGEAIDRDKMMVILRSALASLSPREEKIIRLRFGLGEEPTDDENFPITQDEIEVLNARQGGV